MFWRALKWLVLGVFLWWFVPLVIVFVFNGRH